LVWVQVMQYELSQHAVKRMQQRGIPQTAVDWLLQFGEKKRVAHGQAMFFGKRGRRQMKRHLGKAFAQWDQLIANLYLIVEEQTVVTVGHRYKRIKEV